MQASKTLEILVYIQILAYNINCIRDLTFDYRPNAAVAYILTVTSNAWGHFGDVPK